MATAATSRAAAGAAGAGLVPSKTTAETVVNLAPSAVSDRRVRRLKRSVWASGHLHGMAEKGHRPAVCWFVTLTYAHDGQWHAMQIGEAIKGYRNWCQSAGVPCRYTWVAELTSRGRVHYHLLAWLPHGVRMPHWDRPTRKRSGMRPAFWSWGMTQTEIARSGVGYLMKYLSKLGELTRFPKGLRLYGIGGLDDSGRKVRAWYNLPEWVKRSFGVGEVVRHAGRLLVSATGELLDPAFQLLRVPSGLVLRQLRELPERFHDGAYSRVSFAG